MKKLILSAILAAMPAVAFADDAKEAAVEARQGYFQMLGINMGVLSGMARGEIAYDEDAASTAATNIGVLSNYALAGLFVEGTSSDDMDDTGALPVIWSDSADFATKYAALGEAASGAGEAVKGGQANIGPVLQALGGSCKSCHDKFRKPE
ncbi:MAG: cytochrome c [Paracoccus sp. (in: a-proteobacteria)]|uniref:c-type cytochrome n=1 Tax=Paracoccus sp. TaxID=267 RepID=UPI0026E0676D|nr:cytochrome c [Paracoccus sp. (in: a-proteobacteria)]MDO5633238.1 cytochrome c [Paracoccus sp. (in: a-proteobacteria)]